MDPASGALTPLDGSALDPGMPVDTFTIHPSGRFLYLKSSYFGYGVQTRSRSIFGFAIDPSTGGLGGAVPGSPTPVDGYRLIVSPDGQLLYVGDSNNFGTVGFHVDPGTGALTPLPGSPFGPFHSYPVRFGPTAEVLFDVMAFASNGRALYGLSGSGLWVYRVDPSTGMLDNLRRVATVTEPPEYFPRKSLTIEPSGRFLYVPSSFSDYPASPAQIEAFAIDPGTGDLSRVPGGPFFQEPESARILTQVVADPTGRFLYASQGAASGEDLSDIWAYAIDRATGVLAVVPGSPFVRGRGVRSAGAAGLVFDPGGKRLYVAACDKVHIVEVDDGGRLNPSDWVPLAFCSHELGVVP